MNRGSKKQRMKSQEVLDKIEQVQEFAESLGLKACSAYWDDDDPEQGHTDWEELASLLLDDPGTCGIQTGMFFSQMIYVEAKWDDEEDGLSFQIVDKKAEGENR